MKKICCIVLAMLCLLPCLAGCGKANAANEEPLIRSFVIGNSTAEIQPHTEDGEMRYVIELGGRPILNLTLENRDLVVTRGEQSQTYSFQVGLE